MTDTHTHIYLSEEFPDDREVVLRRALDNGVRKMIFPNVDESTVSQMLELHHAFPEETRIAAGLHPTEVKADWKRAMQETLRLLDEPGCVAVGEVGIDLYWDKTFREEQMLCFAEQLKVASQRRLPVIIHCRDGLDEVLEVISSFKGELPPLIFHSFTLGPEEVKRIRKICDAWFGINGVVTFRNATQLRESLQEIGVERILLETDSPYLAPVPYRGRRNESGNIPLIRDKIAEVLGMSPQDVEEITDRNAALLFGL